MDGSAGAWGHSKNDNLDLPRMKHAGYVFVMAAAFTAASLACAQAPSPNSGSAIETEEDPPAPAQPKPGGTTSAPRTSTPAEHRGQTAEGLATGADAIGKTHEAGAAILEEVGRRSLGEAQAAGQSAQVLGNVATGAKTLGTAATLISAYQKEGAVGVATQGAQILVEDAGGDLVAAVGTTLAAGAEVAGGPVTAAGAAGFQTGLVIRDHTAAGRWVQDTEYDLLNPHGTLAQQSDRMGARFRGSEWDLSHQFEMPAAQDPKRLAEDFAKASGASPGPRIDLRSIDLAKLNASTARTNAAESARLEQLSQQREAENARLAAAAAQYRREQAELEAQTAGADARAERDAEKLRQLGLYWDLHGSSFKKSPSSSSKHTSSKCPRESDYATC
jgi:hypothetical protein